MIFLKIVVAILTFISSLLHLSLYKTTEDKERCNFYGWMGWAQSVIFGVVLMAIFD